MPLYDPATYCATATCCSDRTRSRKLWRAHRGVFVVFDIFEGDRENLCDAPLAERRRLLHRHVQPEPGIHIIHHIDTHAEALFRTIVEHDQEGIVAKRVDALYRGSAFLTGLKFDLVIVLDTERQVLDFVGALVPGSAP